MVPTSACGKLSRDFAINWSGVICDQVHTRSARRGRLRGYLPIIRGSQAGSKLESRKARRAYIAVEDSKNCRPSFDRGLRRAIIHAVAISKEEMSMTTATMTPPRGVLAGKKFILGGIIIIAMVLFLVATSLQSTGVYYLTVDEARTQLRPGGTQVVR